MVGDNPGTTADQAPAALHPALAAWGWDEAWESAWAEATGVAGTACRLAPARVVAQHRGRWILASATGEIGAVLTGSFRHGSAGWVGPSVGDWAGLRPPTHAGDGRIDLVLPRRSAFRRRAAGSRVGAQVIAANVDTLFVVTSLNADLNVRRLERYVTMARESGAEPVLLITKTDLVGAFGGTPDGASGEDLLGVPVVRVSAHSGEGLGRLEPWLAPGRTIALVGSSGVGKSTLLNRLAGTELMATREIRQDDGRGRHATTHRELFRLPNGVLVLDTPGMRELGVWDADEALDDTFAEIVELARRCRFADCAHDREPGCAVRAAIEAGGLDESRLRSYRRLGQELAEQPSAAELREAQRRFSKVVRNGAAASMARKSYRG